MSHAALLYPSKEHFVKDPEECSKNLVSTRARSPAAPRSPPATTHHIPQYLTSPTPNAAPSPTNTPPQIFNISPSHAQTPHPSDTNPASSAAARADERTNHHIPNRTRSTGTQPAYSTAPITAPDTYLTHPSQGKSPPQVPAQGGHTHALGKE